MDWIRRSYNVPARIGGRVIYAGGKERQYGTILGAKNGRLLIRLDGAAKTGFYHPTWNLEYLAA